MSSTGIVIHQCGWKLLVIKVTDERLFLKSTRHTNLTFDLIPRSHNVQNCYFLKLPQRLESKSFKISSRFSSECNQIISEVPYSDITASSHKLWRKKKSCTPDMGDISSSGGWCPKRQTSKNSYFMTILTLSSIHKSIAANEWLQFDLGPPTKITGLVTKGQGDRRCFVTSYSMSYSNDSSVWYFYKDVNHYEPKIFGGNMDKHTERRHYLNMPVTARYVRFHPVSWHRKIGLRAGVIGCRYRGACGPGFLQVNTGSSCSKRHLSFILLLIVVSLIV